MKGYLISIIYDGYLIYKMKLKVHLGTLWVSIDGSDWKYNNRFYILKQYVINRE